VFIKNIIYCVRLESLKLSNFIFAFIEMEFGINMSEDFNLKDFLLHINMVLRAKLKPKKLNLMKKIC
jgi:hypothetical protein